MNAGVTMWARSEWRRRRGALALLAVLVAIVGGTTVAASAAARRTDTAFDRMLAATRAPNLSVSALGLGGGVRGVGDLDPALLDRVMQIDGVTGLRELAFVAVAAEEYPNYFALAAIDERGAAPRAVSLDGPDREHLVDMAADEVLLNESMRDVLDKGAGAVLQLHSLTREQLRASLTEDGDVGPPRGPSITARVVGVGRTPEDVSDAPDPFLLFSRAFYETYGGAMWSCRCIVEVNADPDAVDEVTAELAEIYPDAVIEPSERLRDRVDDTVRIQRQAWWAIALAAALAGVVALLLASTRFARSMMVDDDAHRALGMTRLDGRLGRFLVVAPAVVAGTIGAAGFAYVLSPLSPVGITERAEPQPGLRWDGAVAIPALAAVLAVSMLVSWVATVVVHRRVGRVDVAIGRGGPVTSLGTRFAFGPGRGAIAGVLFATAGSVGALTLDHSIDRVVTTPALYGADFDASVFLSDGTDKQAVGEELASDADVEAVAFVWSERPGDGETPVEAVGPGGSADVEPHALESTKGTVTVRTIEGRAPIHPDEVAVGSTLLGQLGADVGDTLTVAGSRRPARLTIVGVVVDPGVDSAGQGFALTDEGLAVIVDPAISGTVVRFAPGADHAAVIDRHAELYLTPVAPPSEVGNIAELGGLPGRVGQLLALLGIAALLNAIALTVGHGRRQVAIHRALGFTDAQVIGAHLWQGVATASVGIAAGGVAGFVIGRAIARKLVQDVGAIPAAVLPTAVLLVGLVALGVCALAGFVTGVTALRRRPVVALRVE